MEFQRIRDKWGDWDSSGGGWSSHRAEEQVGQAQGKPSGLGSGLLEESMHRELGAEG